jgi:hypothetical protein
MRIRRRRCRQCKAVVLTVTMHPSGRDMQLDPEPVTDGNIVLRTAGGQRRRTPSTDTTHAEVLSQADREEALMVGWNLYRAHGASCSRADRWPR